jgi:MerR family copper efflux transcriptional regulator
MYIGKLANLCAVSTKTIRHYEQIGLLAPPARKGNYRIYREQDVELVRLIKHSQQLGFSLAEMTQAITRHNQGIPWLVIDTLIEQKLQLIAQDILTLEHKRQLLQNQQSTIRACLANDPDCQQPLA